MENYNSFLPKGENWLQEFTPDFSPDSNKTESISALEEDILNLLLGRELYGLQISQAFEEASNQKRHLSVGSLYPTLSKLEIKGLVTSRMDDRPSDSKGGARRKYFKITRRGAYVLSEAQKFREQLYAWQPAQA